MSLDHHTVAMDSSNEKEEGIEIAKAESDSGETTGLSNAGDLSVSYGESGAGTDGEKIEQGNEEADGGALKPVTTEGGYEYLTGWQLFVVLFVVTFVAFLMLLDTSIIVTAIPRITSDFHSLDDVGWYGAAYLISSCALQPLAGKMYTHYSSKWLFLSFVAIFELGSLICGVAVDSKMLIVGRAVAGIGSSGLMNGAFTIVGACVPIHKLPFYIGILTGCAQLGILFGPLIGGALTQYTTWRWCFYINLPVGGLAAILLLRIQVPDRTVASTTKLTLMQTLGRLDIIGFLIFAPAAIQCLLALQWGGVKLAWHSATIIGLFCGSAGTLACFFVWEYRLGDAAMLPVSVLRRRIVYSSSLVMFFFFGNLYMTTYYLPIYFQAVRNATPTLSGVYLLPGILGTMMFAIGSGIAVGKMGYYLPWSVASGIFMAIGSALLAILTPNSSTGKWVGFQLISGVGRGMGFQMPIVAVQNDLPRSQASIGTSMIVFSQTFGGAVILSVGQTIFNEGLKTGLKKFAPNVDVQTVIHAGATAVEEVVHGKDYDGVVAAYNLAINHGFYLATGCAVGAFGFAWGIGWKSVKKAPAAESDPEAQQVPASEAPREPDAEA